MEEPFRTQLRASHLNLARKKILGTKIETWDWKVMPAGTTILHATSSMTTRKSPKTKELLFHNSDLASTINCTPLQNFAAGKGVPPSTEAQPMLRVSLQIENKRGRS